MLRRVWFAHTCALIAYAAAALVFSWPLAAHLTTHLPGDPGGDTGVYVWNLWVFHHELVDHRTLPYFTDTIFAAGPRANLSLHNYTTFQNLLALPLLRRLGVVATFNVILLLMQVLTAYATFLLAQRVAGRSIEAWLGGLLFAWSPLLVTRTLAHFSLVAAAPLAIFLWLLVREDAQLVRHGFSAWRASAFGAAVWWATSTDVYYGVYCVLIAVIYVLARITTIKFTPDRSRSTILRRVLDVLLLSAGSVVGALTVSAALRVQFFGRAVERHHLYTPVLVFTVIVLARLAWSRRPVLYPLTRRDVRRVASLTAVASLVALVLMSPVLVALTARIAENGFERRPIFWRSSPPGIDVLALFVPNPNHPLMPAAATDWLATRPNGFVENVVSVPLCGILVLVLAWRAGWTVPRKWAILNIVFGLLAFGPFVTVAGTSTYVPGPWALLRYAPLIGLARSPTRFAIVMMLAYAVVFVAALTYLGRTSAVHRRWILSLVAPLLVFELWPLPRPLYSAAIPTIYRDVEHAPSDVRLLELPFGFRDGTTSIGNASARTQYFQTAHGKPIQGGYLSRVSRRRVVEARRDPVFDALITLSEGKTLDPNREGLLNEQGPSYLDRHRLGLVVIDRGRATTALREVVVRAFRLQLVASDGPFELYRPI